jgi:hypothetical protein
VYVIGVREYVMSGRHGHRPVVRDRPVMNDNGPRHERFKRPELMCDE